MKATRDGFGDQLLESAKRNKKIIGLGADLGKATRIDKFAEKYPKRFFECGIAENNMIGIASGLAAEGFKPFITSFSAFLTGKYDTIRCSIAYSNEPVIIVGSHGGLAIGRDGVTQMGLEDVAIMRALPNMTIFNPGSYIEARAITKYLCEENLKGPHYLRIGRQPIKEIFDENYYNFILDNGICIKNGDKGIVFTTGCMLPNVIEATKKLNVRVIHFPVLKPFPKYIITHYAEYYDKIITVEDHSIIGGLGSIVAEVLAESEYSSRLLRIGLQDQFPESGSPDDLYDKYGLSIEKIRKKVSEFSN